MSAEQHSATPPHGDKLAEGHGPPEAPASGGPAPAEPPRPHGDKLAPAGVPLPGGEAPAPEAPVADPRAAAEARAQEYLALAQRSQADFDNYRKRMAREAAVAVDRGVSKVARELLPALDHLETAIRAAEEHDAGEWLKGIKLVQDEFVNALGRVGIQPFSPQGEPFDPSEHEAVAQQPVEGAEPGSVVEVYQQGYRLNGAVLRPARVVVAA